MAEWLTQLLCEHGLALLYVGTLAILLICGLGVPVPEEATFLAAGYAASKIPHAHLGLLCMIGVVGIVAGDTVPFLVGKHYGMDFLRHRFLAWVLTPKRIARAQDFFRAHGPKTVFCARFVAGLRMPTFFLAASMGVKYRTFLFWDLMGALISCPISIVLAYYFGLVAEEMLAKYKLYALAFVAGLVLAGIVVHFCMRRKDTPAPVPEQRISPPGHKLESSAAPRAERAELRQ